MGVMENYSLGVIEVNKGMMVFERKANIWVPVTQFCDMFLPGS
jgi:hypothetical protein